MPSVPRRPFSDEEYDQRLYAVRHSMWSHRLDTLVVTQPENMFYLTNYHSPGVPLQMLVVPLQGDVGIATRLLESSNVTARTLAQSWPYDETTDAVSHFAHCLDRIGAARVGYDATSMSHDFFCRMVEHTPGCSWVDMPRIVHNVRACKSPAELVCISKAATYVAAGYKAALKRIRTAAQCGYSCGLTESEVAGCALADMMRCGCEYAAYPLFVASGTNSCIGHHAASRKAIQPDELVFIEIGGCHERYHAARMHTLFTGAEVPAWFTRVRALIFEALEAGRAACRTGARARDVDAAMREVVEPFLHTDERMYSRSGYAIGLGLTADWNDSDMLLIDGGSCGTLRDNMTIHLIPWCQKRSVGSIGFSDTVVVRPGGATSILLCDVNDQDILA